jgi:D-glycero-alpha-D-manno-heptose 1-phosphate guanylyltransferase
VECIVLAGGLGTRLQGVIGAMPKCMAIVAGQPFLFHLFQYLESQNCHRVILSLGYKHEMVENWLIATDWEFEIEIVIETEPLGTGGGISLAMKQSTSKNVFVLNGDTMFRVDLKTMLNFHQNKNAAASLALKQLNNFERYGVVKIDKNGCVQSFEEKTFTEEGLINGGIYILNRDTFLAKQFPVKYSFEKEYLEQYVVEQKFYGFIADTYFIDIGVPEDYNQAQKDFA